MALTYGTYASGGGLRPLRFMGTSDIKCVIGTLTFDTAYATGGESLPASSVGLEDLLFINFTPPFSGGSGAKGAGFVVTYDYTNSKVVALGASAVGAVAGPFLNVSETANAQDLSAFSVRFMAYGRICAKPSH